MLVNEYSWHESLRRLARGVSSLHQHQNTVEKKKGGGRKGKKGGKRQTDTHFR